MKGIFSKLIIASLILSFSLTSLSPVALADDGEATAVNDEASTVRFKTELSTIALVRLVVNSNLSQSLKVKLISVIFDKLIYKLDDNGQDVTEDKGEN